MCVCADKQVQYAFHTLIQVLFGFLQLSLCLTQWHPRTNWAWEERSRYVQGIERLWNVAAVMLGANSLLSCDLGLLVCLILGVEGSGLQSVNVQDQPALCDLTRTSDLWVCVLGVWWLDLCMVQDGTHWEPLCRCFAASPSTPGPSGFGPLPPVGECDGSLVHGWHGLASTKDQWNPAVQQICYR